MPANPFRDAIGIQCHRVREKERKLLTTKTANQIIFAQE